MQHDAVSRHNLPSESFESLRTRAVGLKEHVSPENSSTLFLYISDCFKQNPDLYTFRKDCLCQGRLKTLEFSFVPLTRVSVCGRTKHHTSHRDSLAFTNTYYSVAKVLSLNLRRANKHGKYDFRSDPP